MTKLEIRVFELLLNGRSIDAIKMINRELQVGLRDAKNITEAVVAKHSLVLQKFPKARC